jgi:flagella basal body P-ring formation protein FlgA
MIRNLVTVVLMLSAGAAIAEEMAAGPRLRALVTVTSDIVRIGDLVENAGAAANVAVFRAPDLGQTGAVAVSRVAEVLRPHDVAGLDTGGLSEVVVTRLSRTITAKDIEDRIARALGGKYGFGDAGNLTITMDRELRPMHIEASAASDLTIARLNVEPRSGRFDVSFELPGSAAARRLPLRFTGTVAETLETATLVRTMARGEIVRQADVVIERRPKAEVAGEPITTEQVVGFALKRALRSGQAIRQADLMKPEVVQRNETVIIVYEVPGIFLTVRGKALEAGAAGDLISVLNVQSNRTVQATVTGPGRVTIAATMPLVAASVAPEAQEATRTPTQ